MRFYIIAGESSGDLHAANLIRAIQSQNTETSFRGFGGDKMAAAGCVIAKHYRELAFMGFWEVAVNIRTIFSNLAYCKQDMLQFKPDAVILVDYPGFNLRMAKFLKSKGIKVFYYISPQVWAWKASRVNIIKKCVDRMFVILPFEKAFYAKWNYEVDFVGHPLLDELAGLKLNENFREQNHLGQKKIIALLPGSRKQEIAKMLPVMSEMTQHFPDYQFVVAGLSFIDESFYKNLIHHPCTRLVMDQTHDLLHHSYAALVTSGTATLETALFNVPQVVCYKGSLLSYWIGKMLVQVRFIALVNLICEKSVAEELIQGAVNVKTLQAALYHLLDSKDRERIFSDYQVLREKLGGIGASEETARLILSRMN